MLKKKVCVIALIIMSVFLFTLESKAQEVLIIANGTCGENITWTLDSNGLLSISGSGKMDDYSSFEGNCPWYSGANLIKSVSISGNIENIGKYAFYKCVNMTSINIPDSVTTIGSSAFSSCDSLVSINIPNSVTTIGSSAFFSCDSLTEVVIPENVTVISDGTFENCKALKNVTIPGGVTSIDGFYGCDNLVNVYYQGTVSDWCKIQFRLSTSNPMYESDNLYINGELFGGEITIPSDINSIGNNTFYGCNDITKVNIHNSVTSIGESAFESCESLTNVVISNSVTSIGESAFAFCDSLISIDIPNSVVDVGEAAFKSCPALKMVKLSDGMTEIADDTFYGCYSLESVMIPQSITRIGYSAFYLYGYHNIKYIFYGGSSAQWNSIKICYYTIGDNNDFSKAIMHYSATDHSWNEEYTIDVEPTCAVMGRKSFHCSVCDAVNKDSSMSIPVTDNHITELRDEKKANCVSTGYTGDKVCTVCDKIIELGTVVPIKERIEATGKYALLKLFLKQKGLKDSEGNRYFQEVCDATNNLKGIATISYLEDEAQFKFCFISYTNDEKMGSVIMFIEENGSKTVTVNYSHDTFSLTAKSIFNVEYYTFGGNEYFEKTTENILDNNEIQDLCNATLKAAFGGWDLVLLSNLGLDVNMANLGFVSYEEAGTHTWDEGEITTSATCEKGGVKTYTCVICGENATEVIKKHNNHVYDEGRVTVEPTGAMDGERTYTCIVCNKRKVETIPKTGLLEPYKKGDIFFVPDTKSTLKVTSSDAANPTVEFMWSLEEVSQINIPDVVIADGICYKVTSIADNALINNTTVTKVTIGNNVKSIGKNAFSGCKNLKSVTMGKNVTTIGSKAFYNCKSLTKITIPSKVTKIDSYAFKNCKKLSSVTIGKSVKTIGKEAFRGCSKLKSINIKSTKLKTVGKNAFKGIKSSAKIKVPSSKLKSYKNLLKNKGQSKKVKITK